MEKPAVLCTASVRNIHTIACAVHTQDMAKKVRLTKNERERTLNRFEGGQTGNKRK